MLLNIVLSVLVIVLIGLLLRTSKKLKVKTSNLKSTQSGYDLASGIIKTLESELLDRGTELRNYQANSEFKAKKAMAKELEHSFANKKFKGHQVSGVRAVIALYK